MNYKKVLLKISGESLKGQSETILSTNFTISICNQIKQLVDKGIQVAIVVGGGNIWRGEVSEELEMDRSQADWMGMLATVINSLSLKAVFDKMNQKCIVMNSFQIDNCGEYLNPELAIKLMKEKTIVIFGGGTGMTHRSTDAAAALRAKDINADAILMAKNNTAGVYDKDPNKFDNAKHFKTITYKKMQELNLKVLDEEALKILIKEDINTLVFNLNDKDSIINVMDKKIQSTNITN